MKGKYQQGTVKIGLRPSFCKLKPKVIDLLELTIPEVVGGVQRLRGVCQFLLEGRGVVGVEGGYLGVVDDVGRGHCGLLEAERRGRATVHFLLFHLKQQKERVLRICLHTNKNIKSSSVYSVDQAITVFLSAT